MIASALLLLLAQTPVDVWIEQLGSRYPQVRSEAAQRLLEVGEQAAEALEQRTFDDPEMRMRAVDLLRLLRTPRAVLRVPRAVVAQRKILVVQLLVRNPRPEAVRIEPFAVGANRRFVRNARWSVTLPEEVAGVVLQDPRLRSGIVVPARGDAAYDIPILTNLQNRAGFDLRVGYDGPDFELHARATIRVGQESLDDLRQRLLRRREAERADALVTIRYELRANRMDPAFGRLLRLAARSPHRDVRIGIAEAIGEAGRRGERAQIETVCALMLDRDLGISRVAHSAFARICPPRTDVADAYRAVARSLARPGDARSRLTTAVLAGWSARDRRQFLAGVLEDSRAPIVHKRVAALLRQEGIPVEPGAGGLVPRSQITNLRR